MCGAYCKGESIMEYKFGIVREKDMDLLFMESIITDSDFVKTILEKAELPIDAFKVISVELSKTDPVLGESDITVIIDVNGQRYGILIEDKIDAIAMENQYERYKERGKLGIQNGDYAEYKIFIFAPQKYYDGNDEAKKYDYFISYEDHLDYFGKKTDLIHDFRKRQIEQAINKAKSPSNVTINEMANAYFCQYREYQRNNYPMLDLRTKEGSNGYWIQYATRFGKIYILHKTQEGFIDLTFPNTSDSIRTMEKIAEWLRHNGMNNVFAAQTGKSSSLRMIVPPLTILREFDKTPEKDLIMCFETIKKLSDLSGFLADVFTLENFK